MSKFLHYVEGDATYPQHHMGLGGRKIIAHGCNNISVWGGGFVLCVSERWPKAKQRYHEFCRLESPVELLGQVNFVEVEDQQLWIANMITQRGLISRTNPVPVDYSAIEKCLNQVALVAKNRDATVHMPRIGCGLGGGDWGEVEPLILKQLCDQGVHVYVYDLNPRY